MRAIFIIPALVVLLVLVLSSVFIVDERKKALVLQFGEVVQVKQEPGLGFKVPLMQDVVLYEDRILGLQTQPIASRSAPRARSGRSFCSAASCRRPFRKCWATRRKIRC
jgi:regulator of protease activity HflC (stomatin/prohibitin superfamily)